jgi:hypothetical protein
MQVPFFNKILMLLIFLGIFVLSIAWAVRSMHDFIVPQSIKKLLTRVRHRGTILFFKGGPKHYKK